MSRMHKTTIYLDDYLYEQIQRIANATGQTQAAVIREALEAFTRPTPRRPRSIGIASGPAEVAAQADELLEGFGEDR
jgi:predicted transcriptional regulator